MSNRRKGTENSAEIGSGTGYNADQAGSGENGIIRPGDEWPEV